MGSKQFRTPTKSITHKVPEILSELDSEDKSNNDPNAAEQTNDEYNKENNWDSKSELEEIQNNLENNSALDLHSLMNFPDLLDIRKPRLPSEESPTSWR